MAKKTLLIYNPTAGKGGAAKLLPQVETMLRERGLDYELALTRGMGDARFHGRRACVEGFDLVVAAGGDGTVNECINGMMEISPNGRARPALGVLPVGTGNDFAFGAGIPLDLGQAADVLAAGSARSLDLGRVQVDEAEGRYFCNGIGLGFDAVAGFEAAKVRWLRGAVSYLVGLVKTIFIYARPPVYELDMDGRKQRRAYLMISIMNGRRMGGMFLVAPDANPGDGRFDLCLAGYVTQIKILGVALLFIKGTHTTHPEVQMTHARRISIRAVDTGIPAHADGEKLCTSGRSLEVEILPGALQVLAGPAAEQA